MLRIYLNLERLRESDPYCLRMVPTNTEVHGYAEKQTLARAIGIQKENWG